MARQPEEMGTIRRGTTAPVTVKIEGCDLTGLTAHLSLAAGILIVKASEDGELIIEIDATGEKPVSTVTANLTQEDTLSFVDGVVGEVQLRAFNADGSEALATTCGRFKVGKILEEGKLGGAQ